MARKVVRGGAAAKLSHLYPHVRSDITKEYFVVRCTSTSVLVGVYHTFSDACRSMYVYGLQHPHSHPYITHVGVVRTKGAV